MAKHTSTCRICGREYQGFCDHGASEKPHENDVERDAPNLRAEDRAPKAKIVGSEKIASASSGDDRGDRGIGSASRPVEQDAAGVHSEAGRTSRSSAKPTGIDGLRALERLAILKERNARHQREWRKRREASVAELEGKKL